MQSYIVLFAEWLCQYQMWNEFTKVKKYTLNRETVRVSMCHAAPNAMACL